MTARQRLQTLYEMFIVDLRILWFSVLPPLLLIWGAAVVPSQTPLSQRLVSVASLLQIAGVLQVAWGLHQLRVELGQPSLWSLFTGWLGKARTVVWRAKSRVDRVVGMGSVSFGFSTQGRGFVVNPSSIESRVAALETQVRWLQEDLQSKIAEVHHRVEIESAELRQENVRLRTDASRLRELLDSIFIGGLDLEVAGLAWILIGQILATWPQWFTPIADRLRL